MSKTFQTYRPFFQVMVLWLAGLGAAMQFAKIGVTFSYVRAQFPDAGAEIGMLLSTISLFGILFGMTAAVLVSRVGFRRMLLFALVLGAVMSLWQSTGLGFWTLLTSRMIEGISHLIIVVAAPTLIAQISVGRHRGMAMTLWSTFFGVAYAITAWFGIPFVETYGLGRLFLVHGGFMLLVAAILGAMLGNLQIIPETDRASLGFRSVLRQHATAYLSPFIAAPAIGWLFYTFAFVSLMSILPEFMTASDRATIMAVMPLGGIAVALIGVTVLLRYMQATRIVILGFSVAFLATILLWLGAPVVGISVGLFAVLGLVQGASFAAVPRLNSTPQSQAIANGAMAQMGNLGNMLGLPVLLAIMSEFGRTGMIITVGLCFLTGAVAHIWFEWLRRK